MIPIVLTYRPIPLIPWMRKASASHPASWDELSPGQLIAVACVYKGTITDDGLISSMLSLPRKLVRKLAPYHKLKIIELISFIQDPKPYQKFILRKVGPFTGPEPRLKDETFGTFVFAESFFSRYNESNDTRDLDRFIACWYRDGRFDEKDIETRAQKIAREDLVVREAVSINYQLICEFLVRTYPYVFKKESDSPKSQEKNTWVDVFDAIVGDDLKDQDKYADLPVSSVLRYLDRRIKKNLEDES